MLRRIALACLIAGMASAMIMPTHAAQPGEEAQRRTTSSAPLRFRRMFAPAERVQDWPTGALRYVPVEGEEFERLVKAVQEAADGGPATVSLNSAEYIAQFDGAEQLEGTLTWEIAQRGKGQAVLPLPHLGIALGLLRWSNSPDPVRLGLDQEGQTVLHIDRTGTITGNWSLRGRRDGDGQLGFRFDAPLAISSNLRLTVPTNIVPTASSGLVELSAEREESREYRVLLGGRGITTIRLPLQTTAPTDQPPILMRSSSVYNLTARGLDLAAVWKLDVHQAQVQRLELQLDPGLQLVAARLGETDVPFTTAVLSAEQGEKVVLDLVDPLSGWDRPLRLTAIGPLPLERPTTLPRIRSADVTWQEGTCTVLVHDPLASRRFLLRDGRQTKYSQLPEPNRGESFELQLFSAEAAVEVELARDRNLAQFATGMSVELGEGTAHANLKVQARVPRGHRGTFSANVAADWMIDAVATVPPEALATWHIDTAEANPQLVLRLARPLPPDSTIGFNIQAHCAVTRDSHVWQANEFGVLKFHNVESSETLLTLRPKASFALALNDAENLARIGADQLSAAQIALFAAPPQQPIYRFDPEASRFTATITGELPQYAAKIASAMQVTPDTLREAYTVRCQPVDQPVRQVVVAFSEPRTTAPIFRISGEGQGALTARRLTADEQAERRIPAAAEAWEIILTVPRENPFEILVDRTSFPAARLPLALLSLPSATLQRGQLTVEAAPDIGLSLRAAGVSSLPDAAEAASPTTRASFQYTPGDAAASVTLLRDKSALVPEAAAYVRHCLVESRYDAAGRGWHVATLRLSNAGKSFADLSLPAEAELSRVWSDGRLITADQTATQIRIKLPRDQSLTTLTVEYRCDRDALVSGGLLSAPLVQIDVPTLLTDWLLWMPADWSVTNVMGGRAQPAAAGPTWSQRLFGMFGRSPASPPLGLASRAGWQAIRDRASATASSPAVSVARQLADLPLGGQRADTPRDWGELLVAAEELANHAGFTLIVDAQEFADARLGPRTPLPDHANGSPLPSWQGPLAQADLVLLSTTGTLTVTSRRSADLFRDQLDWIVPDVLAAAVPGTLRRSIEARGDENRFVTGSDWAARGANFDPATAQTVNLGGDGSAAASFLIRADLHDALSVRIAHLPTMSSWRAAGCILALLGCLSYVRRTRSLLALLIGSAAAALVLPASIVPIATGALWGTALALVWTLLSRTAARRRRDEASSSVANSLRRAAVATSLLLAVTLAEPSELVMPAAAQQTKANAAEESTDNIYRVFIPVDEKEQPTDDKYQVPEQLYDELRSRAAKQDGNNDGWLIRSARYQLSLQRADAMSDALVASDVAVRYEIEVFRPDTECRLPLMGVRPGPVIRQEGRETDLEWDIDEDGFLCRFVEAGPYQLELSVRTQRGESTVGSLDMPIPAVPRSALEVQLPTSLPVVEVPSAYGATVSSADGRQLRTDLGPAERLSLRWARPRLGGRSSQTGGEAEQWLWLQVQPASVVLHTRLDIKGMKTPLTELRFSIDPRLRALPVVDRSGTVASVQAVPGDPQSVRVELARPVVDHVTIPVSFLLTGSSGIGQLSLPRVVPQGIRVNERVLAVSVEPALQFESPPVPPEAAVSVTDFLARWGGAPTAPQAVVKLGTDQVWSIATRPRETAHTIKQRLGVSIDEGRAVVRFDAQIIPAEGQLQPTGYVLQYRLTAPPALEVDKISLLQEGIDRVSRWTRDEQGTLTLFLAGPTSGRQQLTLHGWLATPQQGDWELPHIDVDSPGRRDTTVQIWRQPSVLFAVSPQHSLVEAERTRDNEEANLPGRLVAAFVAGQDAFAAPVRIMRNMPRARSTLVTTVTREGENTVGQIEYRTTVEDGCLDAVTFQLPAMWMEPFDASPAAAVEVVSSAAGMRQLRVRPKVPIEGSFQIVVRSPLQIAPGEKLSPPNLVAAEGEDVASYFVLPTIWGTDRIAWQTSGMQPGLIAAEGAQVAASKDATSFRVIDPQAAAWLALDQHSPGMTASHADVSIAWNPAAPSRGQIRFTMGENAAPSCRLSVAEETKILEIRQGGLVITPPRDDGGWLIDLPPQAERQTIEVVFENREDQAALARSRILHAPWLEGIEIAETSWSLYRMPAVEGERLEVSADAPQILQPSSARTNVDFAFAGGMLNLQPPVQFVFAGSVPSLTLHRGGWSDPVGGLLRFGAALLLAIAAGAVAAYSGPAIKISPMRQIAALSAIVLGIWGAAWIQPAALAPLAALAALVWILWPSIYSAPPRERESHLAQAGRSATREY